MDTVPFRTRFLTPDDAQAFMELRIEGLTESPTAFVPSVEEQLEQGPPALAQSEAGFVLGAFAPSSPTHDEPDQGVQKEGELIAIAGLYRDMRRSKQHKALVWGVYASTRVRGQGAGRRLMERMIEEARHLGLSFLTLGVSNPHPAARTLYESLGFVAWGREPAALRVGDELFDEVFLTLDLRKSP